LLDIVPLFRDCKIVSRVRTIPSSAPNTQYPILWLLTIPIPIPEMTSFVLIKIT